MKINSAYMRVWCYKGSQDSPGAKAHLSITTEDRKLPTLLDTEFWSLEEILWEVRRYSDDIVGFVLYNTKECHLPYRPGTGALGNNEYGLSRGWSSRSGVFNQFGFTDEPVIEVTINNYAGFYMPLSLAQAIVDQFDLDKEWDLEGPEDKEPAYGFVRK